MVINVKNKFFTHEICVCALLDTNSNAQTQQSCVKNSAEMVINMENVIRNRRKELGLSQEELAKKCGVSRQTVNAIENNKYDPTLSLAFSLARELTITVDELFLPS